MKGDLVPLALTDRRIAVLKTTAATIPWSLRAQLTQRLAPAAPSPQVSGLDRKVSALRSKS